MTSIFKQRIYLYCALSTISFLGAFLLYDLLDAGIATDQLLVPCVALWMSGILLGFKAADTWSGWDDDTSEDTNVRQYRSNAYSITFYTEAGLVAMTAIFLLVFTIIRNQPTINESCVLAFALVIAGLNILLGHLSRHLD